MTIQDKIREVLAKQQAAKVQSLAQDHNSPTIKNSTPISFEELIDTSRGVVLPPPVGLGLRRPGLENQCKRLHKTKSRKKKSGQRNKRKNELRLLRLQQKADKSKDSTGQARIPRNKYNW